MTRGIAEGDGAGRQGGPSPSVGAIGADGGDTPRPDFFDRFTERQMALGVILFGLLLYIPFAGTYGLWDPWETHYSEVARQMTFRGDYISLWWPGSPRDVDVFWSKPVLSFWIMSLGMHLAGIGSPGGAPGEMALSSRAEWAVRTPFCLMGVLGIYAVYLVAARFVSRRAGVLSAVVLATAPMYSLVARQAMTDMAFVGPMAMALALGALALFDDRDELLPRRGKGWRSWPDHGLFYGTLILFAVCVIPQLVIDSIQLKVEVPWGERTIKMYGAVAMIPYYIGFALFVVLAARTRYKAPLYLYLAAILCGLAVLAKGLAGLGLPLIVFLAYLAFTWNWRRLRRAQLLYGVLVSLVALAVVAVPWHHAMLIRHGLPFWNELFGDNHWRRMVIGRHGDRGSFEYFLRELGYGMLPWVAVAPAALGWAVMRARGRATATPDEVRRQEIVWLGAIWFVSSYAVVSLSMTKFHHYVLPAIPGLAIVVGCYLDDLLRRGTTRAAAATVLVGLPLLLVITVDLVAAKNAAQRFLWLFSYDYVHSPHGRPWPEKLDFTGTLIAYGVAFTVLTAALASKRARKLGLVGLGGAAVVFTYFLLDGYMRDVAPYWSQKGPIATYYQHRSSPEERLVAYQMYWRGETFYTKNEIYEGPMEDRTVFDADGADEKFKEWLSRHGGHRQFFLFERGQQQHVQQMLPVPAQASFKVIDDTNNKFSVAQADL
ncbi:MAG TPA: glycosyltransferase family 39 protein [Polyangia bacterium]|nr:glycosyltransferase family 39 protein [Polyangia bacterium]